MNQRLVWNFEFAHEDIIPITTLARDGQDHIKWEYRCFWSKDEVICLANIDNSLLDLANYQHKHREDYYFILPDANYNIKRRRNELLYKPVMQRTPSVTGFGSKINLDSQNISQDINSSYLNEMAHHARQHGIEMYVRKEAFIYKFPTSPSSKLELARLEVKDDVYFSVCVEGKSLHLVELYSEYLLGKHPSCDYVTFLKKLL